MIFYADLFLLIMQQQEDSKALLKQKEDSLQEARSTTEEQLRQQFLELTEVRITAKSKCTCTCITYICTYINVFHSFNVWYSSTIV